MITHENVQPSHLKKWEDIDQTLATHLDSVCHHPEWYGWYKVDGKYYPHRLPTLTESERNEFH